MTQTAPSVPEPLVLKIPGAARRFTFVHWTDIHLCACDDRNANMIDRMKKRVERWGCQPDEIAVATAARIRAIKPDFVAITGDLVDQGTEASLDSAAAIIRDLGVPAFITLGNHDHAQPGEKIDRDAWRGRMKMWAEHAMDFHVAEFAGVKLMFIDNADYQVTGDQLQRTREALDAGGPCLLFCHIPWYLPTLATAAIEKWREPILACTQGMEEDRRLVWGMGPVNQPSTIAFLDLLRTHPNLRAAFTGHLHIHHADDFTPGRTQYVTGGGFEQQFRVVHVEPV